MMESICGQGFAYAYEVEEDRQKGLVKLGQKSYRRDNIRDGDQSKISPLAGIRTLPFKGGQGNFLQAKQKKTWSKRIASFPVKDQSDRSSSWRSSERILAC
jgi:hypothetical protein